MHTLKRLLAIVLGLLWAGAHAQVAEQVIDIPTRPGVIQRVLLMTPAAPQVAVVLFPGGHGGLQIQANGAIKWGQRNFLVRSRPLFADAGMAVALVDAPSDRQSPTYLQGFRQTPEHVADIQAVIRSLKERLKLPVWLVGTSRGTQSVAFLATELAGGDAPDGIVLSSTILTDDKGRAVPAMPLSKIRIPVLVVHHEQDGCRLCSFSLVPGLMGQLVNAPRSRLIAFQGGDNQGDPCEALAHHGYNGIEHDVVSQIAGWMLAK